MNINDKRVKVNVNLATLTSDWWPTSDPSQSISHIKSGNLSWKFLGTIVRVLIHLETRDQRKKQPTSDPSRSVPYKTTGDLNWKFLGTIVKVQIYLVTSDK